MDYTVNTDRTVYDKVTKLTWEGLVDNRTVPQEEAARYCAGKPGGNWRLPTLLELVSLVDFTRPSTDPKIRAEFQDRPTDKFFWTSSHAPPCGPSGKRDGTSTSRPATRTNPPMTCISGFGA